MSASISAYREAVRDQLTEYGFNNPEINVDQVYQVDLDGDGADEVLILANHNQDGMYRNYVTAGDYSLLLLRYLENGQPITLPLYQRWITQDSKLYLPGLVELQGVADLNGDGVMEIIAKEHYRDRSFGYMIYDYNQRSSKPVLYTWCGE